MKDVLNKFIILSLFVAYVAADVAKVEQEAKIVAQQQDIGVDGVYQWSFQTDNGISAGANGALNNPQSEEASQVAQGQAQWTAPGGEVIRLEYIADENGYQPQGSHIPTPPPIPKYIIDALEYIRSHPPPPSADKN